MIKISTGLLALFFSFRLLAAGEVDIEDDVPNFCWQDSTGKQVCLYDAGKDHLKVLIYTTGYCQACADAMPKLIARLGEVKDQPVVFYNLVAGGDKQGDEPTADVLKAWQTKFSIPFTVASSPDDAGTAFFFHAQAPTVEVVDKDNTLDYKSDKINLDELFKEIQDDLKLPPDPGN